VAKRFQNQLLICFVRVEYVLNKLHGFGIAPRRPLLPLDDEEGEKLMASFAEMIALENEYR
jgi:4-hydroxy-2-oxoglutarate aldolase